MTIGFLSGPCLPLNCLPPLELARFDRLVGAMLLLHRGEQGILATFGRDGWERRAAQLAAALGFRLYFYYRDHEKPPDLLGGNHALTELPGYKACEEFLAAECRELLLWNYPDTLVPPFRRAARYTHLDRI